MRQLIYLDSISAMPPFPEAMASLQPYLTEEWGNPMSPHVAGDRPRAAVDRAREEVAGLLGADPREIYFTSSGSEANNLAIKGIVRSRRGGVRHIVTSAIEHPSVLASCQALDAQGGQTTYVAVDTEGRVDPEQVLSSLTNDTSLVSIQLASSEIGTVQPIEKIGALVGARGIPFHVDAVAAAGRLPLDLASLPVDALSLSADQLGGPPGVGVLFVRRGVRMISQIHGGTQERGRRAGRENVPGIVGMGVAARLLNDRLGQQQNALRSLQRRLFDGLQTAIDGWRMTGHPVERLPGHLSTVMEYVEGEALVMALSREGLAAATGVTCRDRTAWKVSPALLAVGLDQGLAQSSVIFSLWAGNTAEEIDRAIDVIAHCAARLRELSPLYAGRRQRAARFS